MHKEGVPGQAPKLQRNLVSKNQIYILSMQEEVHVIQINSNAAPPTTKVSILYPVVFKLLNPLLQPVSSLRSISLSFFQPFYYSIFLVTLESSRYSYGML